ncbi:NAD(P)-binding protein [Xylophilus rhododendri]|uniref:NAD(P)-binding protein n=1 Tax=Xylophilus rhododendri TaxID=2697032 RepID=A0A857J401_9BURK|nr:FAD-dependent oxidoreductase [Xylophilus rhododendri]QHI97963.1 NAD(P)-binding protein [Xylophilus rhododendri]
MKPALTVLGAGIAGLAAAAAARGLGRSCVVYEAATRAGGLLDAIEVEGYRFDQAVHVSFADKPELRAVFDRTQQHRYKPQPLCVDHPYWLRHPVQNHLYPLPAEERVALIEGFVARPDGPVRHYGDWLAQQYGEPLARRFPERYTRKYWTLPAQELGTAWIGQRMNRPALADVLRGALTDTDSHAYYVSEVRYPEKGGFRAFIEPLMAEADIRTGHRLQAIDTRARRLRFGNGIEADYEKLVSTLPLPELVRLATDVPDQVCEAARHLVATSVDLLSFGVQRPDAFSELWFYIYDDDVLAARAHSPSAKSADNCPPGCSSIQFEIYSSAARPHGLSADALAADCVRALEKWGMARGEELRLLDHRCVRWANVLFPTGMEAQRQIVLDWAESAGIACAGRFGAWEYLWSHQAYASGQAAAQRVLAAA